MNEYSVQLHETAMYAYKEADDGVERKNVARGQHAGNKHIAPLAMRRPEISPPGRARLRGLNGAFRGAATAGRQHGRAVAARRKGPDGNRKTAKKRQGSIFQPSATRTEACRHSCFAILFCQDFLLPETHIHANRRMQNRFANNQDAMTCGIRTPRKKIL